MQASVRAKQHFEPDFAFDPPPASVLSVPALGFARISTGWKTCSRVALRNGECAAASTSPNTGACAWVTERAERAGPPTPGIAPKLSVTPTAWRSSSLRCGGAPQRIQIRPYRSGGSSGYLPAQNRRSPPFAIALAHWLPEPAPTPGTRRFAPCALLSAALGR